MKEIWREPKGFEGKYKVSNFGRVYAYGYYFQIPHHGRIDKAYRRGHYIKQDTTPDGYKQVTLVDNNGKRRLLKVHRLELSAFTKFPYKSKLQVNHIDEDKANNRLDNLEWCTAKYNVNYGHRTKKAAITNGHPIVAIDKSGNKRRFISILSAAKELGLRANHISECINHSFRKSVGGFHFELDKKTLN